jgi:hypothetical protein
MLLETAAKLQDELLGLKRGPAVFLTIFVVLGAERLLFAVAHRFQLRLRNASRFEVFFDC